MYSDFQNNYSANLPSDCDRYAPTLVPASNDFPEPSLPIIHSFVNPTASADYPHLPFTNAPPLPPMVTSPTTSRRNAINPNQIEYSSHDTIYHSQLRSSAQFVPNSSPPPARYPHRNHHQPYHSSNQLPSSVGQPNISMVSLPRAPRLNELRGIPGNLEPIEPPSSPPPRTVRLNIPAGFPNSSTTSINEIQKNATQPYPSPRSAPLPNAQNPPAPQNRTYQNKPQEEIEPLDEREIVIDAATRQRIRHYVIELQQKLKELSRSSNFPYDDIVKEAGFHQWYMVAPEGPPTAKKGKPNGAILYQKMIRAQISEERKKEAAKTSGNVKKRKLERHENMELFKTESQRAARAWNELPESEKESWNEKSRKEKIGERSILDCNGIWDVDSAMRDRKQTLINFVTAIKKWARCMERCGYEFILMLSDQETDRATEYHGTRLGRAFHQEALQLNESSAPWFGSWCWETAKQSKRQLWQDFTSLNLWQQVFELTANARKTKLETEYANSTPERREEIDQLLKLPFNSYNIPQHFLKDLDLSQYDDPHSVYLNRGKKMQPTAKKSENANLNSESVPNSDSLLKSSILPQAEATSSGELQPRGQQDGNNESDAVDDPYLDIHHRMSRDSPPTTSTPTAAKPPQGTDSETYTRLPTRETIHQKAARLRAHIETHIWTPAFPATPQYPSGVTNMQAFMRKHNKQWEPRDIDIIPYLATKKRWSDRIVTQLELALSNKQLRIVPIPSIDSFLESTTN